MNNSCGACLLFWFKLNVQGSSKSGGESTDSGSALNTLSSKAEAHLEPESPISKKVSSSDHYDQAFYQKHLQFQEQEQVDMANDTSRTGGPSQQNQSPAKSPQEKVLNTTVWLNNLSLLDDPPPLFLSQIPNSGKSLYLYCSLSPYLQYPQAQIPTTRPEPSLITERFPVQMTDMKSEGERQREREGRRLVNKYIRSK